MLPHYVLPMLFIERVTDVYPVTYTLLIIAPFKDCNRKTTVSPV